MNTYLSWSDGIEIIIFATALYYLILWLKADRQKNLLGYFYGYCLWLFISHCAHLTILHHALLVLFPVCILIFVLVHQTTLQKNFVTLRTLSPQTKNTQDWVAAIVQTSLIALNNNQELMYVIEHHDSLTEHLVADLPLHAEISQEFFEIVITSQAFKTHTMIWLNSRGHVMGINAAWQHAPHYLWATDSATRDWRYDALLLTEKTDAIFIKTKSSSRTFDLIKGGKLYESLNTQTVVTMLKKCCQLSHSSYQGVLHESSASKNISQQPHA